MMPVHQNLSWLLQNDAASISMQLDVTTVSLLKNIRTKYISTYLWPYPLKHRNPDSWLPRAALTEFWCDLVCWWCGSAIEYTGHEQNVGLARNCEVDFLSHEEIHLKALTDGTFLLYEHFYIVFVDNLTSLLSLHHRCFVMGLLVYYSQLTPFWLFPKHQAREVTTSVYYQPH